MPTKNIPVLLVEDFAGDARLIRAILEEAGDVRFELTHVVKLEDALDRLHETPFSVVLLDLSLPDSHGLDTFRRLRHENHKVPVVVLTGLDDTTIALAAVQEGAQDYLVKGQVTPARLVHSLRYAVSRHQRQEAVEQAHRANEAELHMARQIQQGLFPRHAPALAGYDIWGASFPAVLTGGDFFDYLPLGEERIGLVIGDVTSHGVGPALLMATTRAYLRAVSQTTPDPSTILCVANRLLLEDVVEHNVTLVLARLNGPERVLQHTSAGHWPGYVLDAGGEIKTQLLSTDLALGIWPGAAFPLAEAVNLDPGDVVLLLTDGIFEARDQQHVQFGMPRALDHVREHLHRPAREIVESLYEAARAWEGDGPQGDDVSVVVVKVL